MSESNLQELELKHKELLFALRLPDAVLGPDAPLFLRQLDLAFARQVLGGEPWGHEDAFDERARLTREVLCANRDGRMLHLASEIDLLSRVRETGKEQIHRGPFDLCEGVFPVRVRDHVIHILRTGKFRETPLSDNDLKELSFLTGVPAAKVRDLAATLPILAGAQKDHLFSTYRQWRDSVSHAFEEHIRVLEMTEQQVGSERLASLGTLAEGMAHHVNNLLSIILGYTSLVTDRSNLPADALEALKKATEAAQKGRRFTEEILAVAGSLDEQEIPCGVHERINGALTLLQGQLTPKIKLEVRLHARHDVIDSPPPVLHQIIFNLLTNAIDTMPTGGLLTISTCNVRDEKISTAPEYLKIEVSDSSGTMPRRSTRKPVGRTSPGLPPGDNMGPKLTSVFGLVGRLDGSVSVFSEPGMNTRVQVVVPVSEQMAATIPEKRIRRRLAPSQIWVADDDSVIREMCKRVLVEEGHTVEEVKTGRELEEKMRGEDSKPDLIIYDYSMPDYDGYEMCTRLRQDGVRVPVLLLSGFKPDNPEVGKTLKMRKTFFLQKPFSFRDMSDMVTVALGETLIEE